MTGTKLLLVLNVKGVTVDDDVFSAVLEMLIEFPSDVTEVKALAREFCERQVGLSWLEVGADV